MGSPLINDKGFGKKSSRPLTMIISVLHAQKRNGTWLGLPEKQKMREAWAVPIPICR